MSRSDILGARLFLGATQHTIEATATVQGSVDSVSAAVLQVFSGHPCLLQACEVAELPSWHIFTREGVEEILNLQPRGSLAKAYQVRQVRQVILKYKLAGEEP